MERLRVMVGRAWAGARSLLLAAGLLGTLETTVAEGTGAPRASQGEAVIAEVASDGLASRLGGRWRVVTDRVMGGVSEADHGLVEIDGRRCVRLTGDVRLERNGGFVQLALDLEQEGHPLDASGYTGVRLLVRGNGETYGMHLRTRDLWFPWQSYRATLVAGAAWSEVRLPFAEFQPYRTDTRLDPRRLIRVGVFAIGRAFRADVCVAELALYR
jgi:hypothetical protein